jgi:hypothetical protein
MKLPDVDAATKVEDVVVFPGELVDALLKRPRTRHCSFIPLESIRTHDDRHRYSNNPERAPSTIFCGLDTLLAPSRQPAMVVEVLISGRVRCAGCADATHRSHHNLSGGATRRTAPR